MPDSYRANGGFRTDLTQAAAALHPAVIRWPGGSFIGDYRWKDGIGPQSKRTGKNGWDEWDPLSFGIDEFIAFTRKMGAEPVVVIWTGPQEQGGSRNLHSGRGGPGGVLQWTARQPVGQGPRAERASRTLSRPYWEIDNEIWEMPAADYVDVLAQFVPAMKKVDPTIRIIACGSGELGARWPEGDIAVIREAAQLVDYLSIHHYENPDRFADGPAAAAKFWKSLDEEIAKIAESETEALHVGVECAEHRLAHGTLCRRHSERNGARAAVGMATPALWLRHVTAPAWDNALINFDQRSWFPAPNYVVMKLYRDHFAPDLLEIAGNPGDLNATATRTADGDRIYVKLVNPTGQEVPVQIDLRGDFPLLDASAQWVAPGSLTARNTLDQPAAVQAVQAKIERTGMTARLRLPAWSVAVVTLSR